MTFRCVSSKNPSHWPAGSRQCRPAHGPTRTADSGSGRGSAARLSLDGSRSRFPTWDRLDEFLRRERGPAPADCHGPPRLRTNRAPLAPAREPQCPGGGPPLSGATRPSSAPMPVPPCQQQPDLRNPAPEIAAVVQQAPAATAAQRIIALVSPVTDTAIPSTGSACRQTGGLPEPPHLPRVKSVVHNHAPKTAPCRLGQKRLLAFTRHRFVRWRVVRYRLWSLAAPPWFRARRLPTSLAQLDLPPRWCYWRGTCNGRGGSRQTPRASAW